MLIDTPIGPFNASPALFLIGSALVLAGIRREYVGASARRFYWPGWALIVAAFIALALGQ